MTKKEFEEICQPFFERKILYWKHHQLMGIAGDNVHVIIGDDYNLDVTLEFLVHTNFDRDKW